VSFFHDIKEGERRIGRKQRQEKGKNILATAHSKKHLEQDKGNQF